QLSDAGFVADAADIYALTRDQLMTLPKWGALKADNLLAAIEGSKTRPLPKVLTALGIKGLGPSASEALSRRFGSLDVVMNATEDDLAATDGVGPVIAGSIVRWFAKQPNRAMVEKLRAAGVDFGRVEVSVAPQVLTGKAVVVTGTLEGFTRERPRRPSRNAAARAPAASAPRRSPWWWAPNQAPARSPRPRRWVCRCWTATGSSICWRPANCLPDRRSHDAAGDRVSWRGVPDRNGGRVWCAPVLLTSISNCRHPSRRRHPSHRPRHAPAPPSNLPIAVPLFAPTCGRFEIELT
ncbi:MAG: hypothetical protein KDB06_13635, partial [Ilumatobacter sp.]|nr:hypothetical protein [Ilumatobacter sp.]